MYCVIQEVPVKSVPKGEPKEILAQQYTWTTDGESGRKNYYTMSEERFERPLKKSFRISIHKSYRENGKVRKQQVAICTIGYYDIIDFGGWYRDCIYGGALQRKLEILVISEEELDRMVCEKMDPIIERVKKEFRQTEEGKVREKHRQILEQYRKNKEKFAKKYDVESDEYDYCYDVFGVLNNPEYLEKIKADYKARREYTKKSRSYYEKSYGNYNGYSSGAGSGSYGGMTFGNYTDDEKTILKQFYRELSKRFHPDSNPDKDTSEHMKLLNQLKAAWGL